MEFRKIGLIWNPTKTSGFEVARELREILAERGLSVTTGITLAHALGAPELAEGSFEECDLLMVLGGVAVPMVLGWSVTTLLGVIGAVSAVFGRYGALRPWMDKHKNDMNGSGR